MKQQLDAVDGIAGLRQVMDGRRFDAAIASLAENLQYAPDVLNERIDEI
jgi:hypothetical protein